MLARSGFFNKVPSVGLGPGWTLVPLLFTVDRTADDEAVTDDGALCSCRTICIELLAGPAGFGMIMFCRAPVPPAAFVGVKMVTVFPAPPPLAAFLGGGCLDPPLPTGTAIDTLEFFDVGHTVGSGTT